MISEHAARNTTVELLERTLLSIEWTLPSVNHTCASFGALSFSCSNNANAAYTRAW